MDVPNWPARNVAEFAYCPRLFYFMEVEGIHVPSSDTEQGCRTHRRVDAPSHTQTSADGDGVESGDAEPVRSLTLTSQRLGLTATLDITEIDGRVAVPVEYRKGRPHHRPPSSRLAPRDESCRAVPADDNDDGDNGGQSLVEPWPTDRVQVGLQVLLLEEAGFTVPRAELYYAAEKRRLIVPVNDDLRREAIETLAAAKACAAGPRPLPLVNDPKCPRCSLQPICLPDEIQHQRTDGESFPRKLWPPRDDGIHLVAQRNGTHVGVRGSMLRITDDEGSKVQNVPLANVESLSLLGSVQASTQALQTLADRGIPVALLSAAGRLIAMVDPLDSVSADTRRRQVRKFDQPQHCLTLARALIAAKIRNQRTLLVRNHESLPPLVADALATEAKSAVDALSLDSLRGHEGQAAAIYFEHFPGMLPEEKGDRSNFPERPEGCYAQIGPVPSFPQYSPRTLFQTNGRQRRPAPDPVNACLSFAYSMLTHECTAALRTARLEPSIGALHVSRPGRPALALDLMEPFRPLIADSLTITAFNKGELKAGHFHQTAAGCLFSDAGRKAFFTAYGRRMDEEITHPAFGYRLSYRRMLILHARMIAAWLNDEIPTLAFLTTR